VLEGEPRKAVHNIADKAPPPLLAPASRPAR